MNGHMIPDQVLHRAEALAEARPLARVPKSPFAFIWFLGPPSFPPEGCGADGARRIGHGD
jgi:hypothetical protein